MKPWDRQEDEPGLWHDRFMAFRNLGPQRTVEAAFRKAVPGREGVRPSRHWYRASSRWNWKARAAAWDGEMRGEANAKAEDTARRSAERITADEWEVYEKGIEKLRQFLSLPLVKSTTTLEETTEDGTALIRHVTVEAMPGVSMASLAALMGAVMKVGRQAAGMEEVDKLTSLTLDQIEGMSETELRALNDQLEPIIERRRAMEPLGPRRVKT